MFSITQLTIDPHGLRQELERLDAGGFCSFEGWVRNHHLGRDVLRLEYEAYDKLANKQGASVIADALDRYEILEARAEHRIGRLEPGELAVWVGVCSVHRDQAFAACRFIIDEIKATVPIWKHEFYADGADEWVDPTACHCDHRQAGKAHHHA